MYNHEPNGYPCPFCGVVSNARWQQTKTTDIFYQDKMITAFVSSKWWKNNPGNVILIPNQHYENIYDIPEDILGTVFSLAKKAACAIRKTYPCEGTSIRQHNEPAGNQDIWHFHVHVFPRYKDDRLYQNHDVIRWTEPEERIMYSEKLKEYFKHNYK